MNVSFLFLYLRGCVQDFQPDFTIGVKQKCTAGLKNENPCFHLPGNPIHSLLRKKLVSNASLIILYTDEYKREIHVYSIDVPGGVACLVTKVVSI